MWVASLEFVNPRERTGLDKFGLASLDEETSSEFGLSAQPRSIRTT